MDDPAQRDKRAGREGVAVRPGERQRGTILSDHEGMLRAAWIEGGRAWPGIALSEARWLAFWGLRAANPATPGWAADAFIVCAVASKTPGSTEALARAVEPALRDALRKTRLAPEDADDVLQRLWEDLLLDEGQGVRLGSWEGRGQLLAFLKVSAVRLAFKEKRAHRAHEDDSRIAEQTTGLTPELSYMKESYREAFRAAFQEALDSLPSREQLLLRQHILDGLSIDELAALHRVHRATTARWVAAAKETLVARTQRRFFAAVALPPEEGEGVLSLVRSRLDETIRRRLLSAG